MMRRFHLATAGALVSAVVFACSSGDNTPDGGAEASAGTSSSGASSSSGGGGDSGSGQPDATLGGSSSGVASSSSSSSSAGHDAGHDSGGGSSSGSSSGAISGPDGAAGPCTWGTAYNGNASFTWYFFGQGPMPFKSACGYNIDETVMNGQNSVDVAANATDTPPASNTYFAAFPGNSPGSGFNSVSNCGACVEITGQNGMKIVATIIDECPIHDNNNPPNVINSACESAGHLDLSTQAFDQLGYGSNGAPSGTTWKFVPCPVPASGSGNSIVAVQNTNGQYYFQNSVYPITTVNGQTITTGGFFNVNPGQVTLTSMVANQTITGQLSGGGGPINAQFAAPSGCY